MNAHRIIIVIVAVLLAASIFVAYSVNRTIRTSYAVWWVADMVIVHLETNDGKWPTGWDELRDDYDICVTRSGQPWTFEELQKRVHVDFDVNTCDLVESARGKTVPEFRVIYASDGSNAHWSGQEPNTKLLDYFNDSTPATSAATGFGGSSAE